MSTIKSQSHKTAINLVCSVGSLIANLLVSFFLSPYIIRTIGVEANGFVNLANSFTTYASLVVTALNAMAARFILFAYVNKDYDRANLYYNSVFWGNLIIVGICLLGSLYLIPNLETIIEIPSHLVGDIKFLFILVFAAFLIRTGAPNWDCGTYLTNRLDRTYVPNMFAAAFKCIFLVVVFSIFQPRVWIVSLCGLITTLALLAVEWHNTATLTPELQISLRKPICSWTAIKTLVGSGIWNSISCAGNMLLHSVDLLVCNLSLGATAMGILSLSKTIPNIYIQLAESLRGAFGPELNYYFAVNDKDGMLKAMRRAMKLTAVTLTVPVAGIIVMSDRFFALWVPSQDAVQLQILTVLGLMNYVLVSGIVILYSLFTIANKVKYNSIAQMISGTASLVVTLILIRFADWDLYAVAGVSCVIGILRDLFFTIPVTSRLIGVKWTTFYPQVGISVLASTIIIAIGLLLRPILPSNTWLTFFMTCGVIGILGLGANMMIILNKDERAYLINMVKQKISRKA